jgi:DNA repair exonuclease SbcCD ATPase subunit
VSELVEWHKTRLVKAKSWCERKQKHAELEAFWEEELRAHKAYKKAMSAETKAKKVLVDAEADLQSAHELVLTARLAVAASTKEQAKCHDSYKLLEDTKDYLANESVLTAAEAALKRRLTWQTQMADIDAMCEKFDSAKTRYEQLVKVMEQLRGWDAYTEQLGTLTAEVKAAEKALVDAQVKEQSAQVAHKTAVEKEKGAHILCETVKRFVEDRTASLQNDIDNLKHQSTAWAAWKPWKKRMEDLTVLHIESKQKDVDEKLAAAKCALKAASRADVLRKAVEQGVPNRAEWRVIGTKLTTTRQMLADVHQKQGAANAEAKAKALAEETAAALTAYANELRTRLETIQKMDKYMGSFRAWMYSSCVAPLLASEVNNTLSLLQAGDKRRIRLIVKWKESQEVFNWYLKDEECEKSMPLVKAGGFQRASVSLSMRIALARLGGKGVASNHLFIDEGFVACDAENMARVPYFLKALLNRYDTVLVVSHIETIKDCADVWIPIERRLQNGNILSRIGYGERMMENEHKPVGRPRKAVTEVVEVVKKPRGRPKRASPAHQAVA